jgi:hypothetical protein
MLGGLHGGPFSTGASANNDEIKFKIRHAIAPSFSAGRRLSGPALPDI